MQRRIQVKLKWKSDIFEAVVGWSVRWDLYL
jgi:hypothetical protein